MSVATLERLVWVPTVEEQLDDRESLERRLQEDPANPAASARLEELYRSLQDWQKLVELLLSRAEQRKDPKEVVELLCEVARIYEDKLGEPEAAFAVLEPALQRGADQSTWDELERLAGALGKWNRLAALYTEVAADLEDRDPAAACSLWLRIARRHLAADDLDGAQGAAEMALRRRAQDTAALAILAEILTLRGDRMLDQQRWDAAERLYEEALSYDRRMGGQGPTRARVLDRLAQIRLAHQDRTGAIELLSEVLQVAPDDSRTLRSIADLEAQRGDYEAVLSAKRALLEQASPDERVRLLGELADLYARQLGQPEQAIATCLEALEICRGDRAILQRLLDAYASLGRWQDAVKIALRMAELEPHPVRRGKYYQAAGLISRDHLDAPDHAIAYLNRALDAFFEDPNLIAGTELLSCLKPFADIDKLTTRDRDWKQQERSYRKMIKRLPAGHALLPSLWHNLGEIYRSRMGLSQNAIAAFEVASRLEPGNAERHQILAEMYEAGPDSLAQAAAERLALVQHDPFDAAQLKTLRKLYTRLREHDKAFCVASALCLLGQGSPREQEFYARRRPRCFQEPRQPFSDDVWRHIRSSAEDRAISAILSCIGHATALGHAASAKALGLRHPPSEPASAQQNLMSNLFAQLSYWLGLPAPEVYVQPDQPGEILLAIVRRNRQVTPAFVLRQQLLARSQQELIYAAARALAFLRPEYFVKFLLPRPSDIRTVLAAAIALVRPEQRTEPAAVPPVAQLLRFLRRRVRGACRERLRQAVDNFLPHRAAANPEQWCHAVEATCRRVGFLLCGDLEVAARMIACEAGPVDASQNRLRDLLTYSVSEDHFVVRSYLGRTIG